MLLNGSQVNDSTAGDHALHRPPWITTTLGCFLIFTIVVDILGNLLVIFSVYRNKKLRNAGLAGSVCTRGERGSRAP
ncbi:melatonin receptor type 1A-A [Tachysurus ichikawai]